MDLYYISEHIKIIIKIIMLSYWLIWIIFCLKKFYFTSWSDTDSCSNLIFRAKYNWYNIVIKQKCNLYIKSSSFVLCLNIRSECES